MSDRSPSVRVRPALVQIHHKAQIASYAVSGLLTVLALVSPDFARAAVNVFRTLIALVLN